MTVDNEKKQYEKMIQLVEQAIKDDEALRVKYKTGDKFRFVRDRMHALLAELQQGLSALSGRQETLLQVAKPAYDSVVYVYLYNAKGIALQSWLGMLTPKVFYEYSVNRPIYNDKKFIDQLVNSKLNKLQHAYLTISIKESDILSTNATNDAIGNPLIKVREGSLHIDHLISLTHNGHVYELDSQGTLVKKT